MDPETRDDIHEFITRGRKHIIEECQIDVILYSKEENIITVEEYQEINSYETRENQIISWLDKLPAIRKPDFEKLTDYLDNTYPWLMSRINEEYMLVNNDAYRVNKILSEADVPALPPNHVTRKNELILLNNYLHNLERGKYVVVCGMGGCGKSTLVVEVLSTSYSLVLDTFHKKIFWLTIGRESAWNKDLEQEDVKELTILQELYTRLFISRGYNAPPFPVDINSAKRVLKDKFAEKELVNCLLILDDVPSQNFIECLNIGCKILVTTDNKNIMNGINNGKCFVRLSEGFTEEESLTLFSKNLDIPTADLSHHANYIHALCKGFPLTISLIASQLAEFKEDVLVNNDRWEVYLNHLKNRDIEAAIGRCDQGRQDQVTLLYKALEMSIASLHQELQDLYQDFALFMDDVNIKPEVLCTLWDMNKKEVEDIMREFEKKCLVITTWNYTLCSYVYCVHDLLLDYLKRKITNSERQLLHQKLIAQYEKKFGNDPINYPSNDNYIFLYLGYHLKEAGYFNDFPKLYFNLKFIETKILIYGPADVLYDYKKYKDLIANNEENIKKYEEFSSFISKIGACRALSTTDIVQFGLAECKESYLYKQAQQLAKNSDKQYFEYLTDTPKDCSSPDVHYFREKITAAIFSGDGNIILANASNVIKLVRAINHESIITYKGHRDKVTLLRLAKNLMYFLSASNDSSVGVWSLNNCSNMEKSYGKPRTPSPHLMQQAHSDPWKSLRPAGEPPVFVLEKHSKPIVDAQFSNNGMMLVTSSEDKKVIIWKCFLENAKDNWTFRQRGDIPIDVDEVVVSCCFTHDDKFICCATPTGLITIYEIIRGTLQTWVDTESPIKSIAVLPEYSYEGYKGQAFNEVARAVQVLILGETYFSLRNISLGGISNSCTLINNTEYNTLRKRHDNCICAAVSGEGKYVAIASSNYDILIRKTKIDDNDKVVKFHETNGKISALSWSPDNTSLMAAYENSVLKVWNIQINDDGHEPVKLKQSVFDAAWIPYQDDDSKEDGLLVTAVLDTENNIIIFYDLRSHKVITQKTSDEDICQMCVCPTDGSIVYATKTGSVHLIVLDSWTSQEIMQVQCVRVRKMKLFYYRSAILVILLVEKVPFKYSLMGWMKKDVEKDEIVGCEIQYIDESEQIFDFSADIENEAVYVAKTDHTCDIYDLKTSILKTSIDGLNGDVLDPVIFGDFSPDLKYMATGNCSQIMLSKLNGESCQWNFVETTPTVSKFSSDGKFLAVGFACGLVQVYDVKDKSVMEFSDKLPEKVLDLIWSAQDYKLMVVLDRNVILYEVAPQDYRLISTLYMSVDKLVCNYTFSKIVTVDNIGNFYVLKHPL